MSKSTGKLRLVGLLGCMAVFACTACDSGLTVLPPGVDAGVNGLTPEQKLRAEQYTSIFENDTIELQYAYAEALNDGRGYTAGRAGFTTATCDALEVIERYTDSKPLNGLAGFIPRLIELCDANSESLVGLDGFPAAWEVAADDADFRTVQDAVVDDFYYEPAVARSASAGLQSPLAVAALYDAIIQHGDGDDPDGLPAMIDRTNQQAGGSPATGVDEKKWLTAFLAVRRATLLNAFNVETRVEWAASVDRVDAMKVMLDDGNLMMEGPIDIVTPNHSAIIP